MREVGLRYDLQFEAPTFLAAKLTLVEAIAATGPTSRGNLVPSRRAWCPRSRTPSNSWPNCTAGRTIDEPSKLWPTSPPSLTPWVGDRRRSSPRAWGWDLPLERRTPVERTVEVARRAVDLGADELWLGEATNPTVAGRIVVLLDAVHAAVPCVEVGVHFHDTRGSGVACALAAPRSA